MSHYLLLSHSNVGLDFWEKKLTVPRLLLNRSSIFPITKFQLIACKVSRYNFCCDFIFSTTFLRHSSAFQIRSAQ